MLSGLRGNCSDPDRSGTRSQRCHPWRTGGFLQGAGPQRVGSIKVGRQQEVFTFSIFSSLRPFQWPCLRRLWLSNLLPQQGKGSGLTRRWGCWGRAEWQREHLWWDTLGEPHDAGAQWREPRRMGSLRRKSSHIMIPWAGEAAGYKEVNWRA